MHQEVKVLDRGFVRLDEVLADDLSVVNSARVSLGKHHKALEEGDDKLIRFLMKNEHGTPFEHNLFRWHIKCPIFIAREWQRHRISSYNEWSGRYSKLEPEFYMPQYWRTQVGKPGAYRFEPLEEEVVNKWTPVMLAHNHHAFQTYEAMIEDGVAKETARIVLPLSIYTQYYWSINARSLMNFLRLRNDEHALWEIRQYAIAVEELFAKHMPITHQAFLENDRRAP